MEKILTVVLLIVFVALSPLLAGEEGYKCDKPAQDCLNYLAAHLQERGWAGVDMDQSENWTPTVTAVYDNTPAKRAGVQVGDVLVAINGIALKEENKEQLMTLEQQMKPGADMTFTVSRHGRNKEISLTLEDMPEDAIAKIVGKHMLTHATAVAAASN